MVICIASRCWVSLELDGNRISLQFGTMVPYDLIDQVAIYIASRFSFDLEVNGNILVSFSLEQW